MITAVLGVCLALANPVPERLSSAFVPSQTFTLAWTHSIEKVRWEEDYQVLAAPNSASPVQLRALKARVRGSAAGMEPPADAVLIDGWYEYTPQISKPSVLRLTRSEFTADYEWCTAQGCRPMSDWLESDQGVTLLWACQGAASSPPTPQ